MGFLPSLQTGFLSFSWEPGKALGLPKSLSPPPSPILQWAIPLPHFYPALVNSHLIVWREQLPPSIRGPRACGPDPILQTSGEFPTTSLISTFPKPAVQEKSRDGQGLSQRAISSPWANEANLPGTNAQGQRPGLPHLPLSAGPSLPLCGLTPLRSPWGSCAHNGVAASGRLVCSGHP